MPGVVKSAYIAAVRGSPRGSRSSAEDERGQKDVHRVRPGGWLRWNYVVVLLQAIRQSIHRMDR